MSQVINQFQALTGWKANAGGSIGGCAPAAYGMIQGVGETAAVLWHAGSTDAKQFPTVEHYNWQDIRANTGLFVHEFDYYLADPSLTEAIEFDTILILGAKEYNFSARVNYATGNLEISNVKGDWVAVPGATPGKLQEGLHHFTHFGVFDEAKGTYGTTAVVIDETAYEIPADMQGLVAAASTWTNNRYTPQHQRSSPLQAVGDTGGYAIILDNETYLWP